MPNEAQTMSLKEAVLSAMFEEMVADERVIMMGEDIGAAGGVFKQTDGLLERFGAARIIDAPISESAIFGLAVGAAMTGSRAARAPCRAVNVSSCRYLRAPQWPLALPRYSWRLIQTPTTPRPMAPT